MMNDELLDKIGKLAEGCDSVLFAYQTMTMIPDKIHLIGLSGKLREVRDKLEQIYCENGGTEELDIQAK